MKMREVYLDYGASTPVDPEVLSAMLPFFTKRYGNPSSAHRLGRESYEACEQAREQVAQMIGAETDEIIFTSGGTESDNLAIKGIAYEQSEKKGSRGANIVTSAIEHPGVLETCRHLERQGYKVTYLPVDEYGLIDIDMLADAITPDTSLVSIMAANNEIGTIEPIEEIARVCSEGEVAFHTDAVQGIGKMDIDVESMGIDMLSMSAHKIYGPKGVGALYKRKGISLDTLQDGGGHERGLRSSTYNTPGIVGLGRACELGMMRMDEDCRHMLGLRDRLIRTILSEVEQSYLTGHPTKRLVNNAHLRFKGVEGESLNIMLGEKGICAATGSACSSKEMHASHVLLALGLDPAEAAGSLRLTLGRTTSEEDIEYVAMTLSDIVKKLRHMSPLWNR